MPRTCARAWNPCPLHESPKFHAYDTIRPPGSLEPLPSKSAVSPVPPTVNEAVGGGEPETVTLVWNGAL